MGQLSPGMWRAGRVAIPNKRAHKGLGSESGRSDDGIRFASFNYDQLDRPREGEAVSIVLDELERGVYRRFVDVVRLSTISPPPSLDEKELRRGPDGRIIIPVTIEAERPSLSLAMLMAHKSEYLYRHSGCRLILAQRPLRDPDKKTYVWDGTWQTLE